MTITTLAIATLSPFMVADAQEKAEAPEATTSLALQPECQGEMADYISEQQTRVIRPMQTRMQEMPRVLPCNTEEERMVSEQAARRIKADYATYLSTAPLEQLMKSLVDLCSERMKELQQIPNSAANAK